jgi:hypothetical protein
VLTFVPSLPLVVLGFVPAVSRLTAALPAVPSLPAAAGLVAPLMVPEEVALLPPEEIGPVTRVSKLAPWPPLLEKAGPSPILSELPARESSEAHPAARNASTQGAKRREATQ